MTNLTRLADYLVSTGAPAVYVSMVDVYIRMYERMPAGKFVLPKNHKDIAPLIEEFAYDLEGLVSFTRLVRDIAKDIDEGMYADLHDVYRSLNTRLVQQGRRARSDKAITCLIKRYGKPEFPVLQEWRRYIEKEWAARRMDALKQRRDRLKSGRLSREETAEIVNKFWEVIDLELVDCDVPDPNGD